jgi:hypothetical protein
MDSFLALNQILWTCALPNDCNLSILFKLSFESTVIWCQGEQDLYQQRAARTPNCFLSSYITWIMLQPTVHFSFCSKGFSANAGSIPYPCVHLSVHWFPSDFHYFSWEDWFYNWIRKAVKVIASGNQWNITILAWKHMFHYKEKSYFPIILVFSQSCGTMEKIQCFLL